MRREFVRTLMLASLAACLPGRAAAQSPPKLTMPRIGLSPAEPQSKSAPPATPFGRPPSESKDAVFDFHGFVLLPMTVGVLERESPAPGQAKTTLHGPPLLPQDLRRFEYTGVVPTPWIQLDFSYGNEIISATTILAARSATDAAGLFIAPDQLGVNDAFLTVNLSKALHTPLLIHVGAFTGRYGPMGEYDAGRYGTPLIAQTNAIGEVITAGFDVGSTRFVIEQGLGGQLGRPARGLVPEGWNDFAYAGAIGTSSADAPYGVGASFVSHLHAAASFDKTATVGLHYLTAWSEDDNASVGVVPDGRITILGADAKLALGRGGHLYAGAARVIATNSATVSGIIEVLNARGGPELIREYLGPNSGGDGSLTLFGAQYDVSVSRLLYGDFFTGRSPDLRVSLFTVGAHVSSDDKTDNATYKYDNVTKLKLGAEVTYSMLPWLGLSARFDRAYANFSREQTGFSIISPRVLFHTDWLSRDEIALQYSAFFYGDNVIVRTGYPPVDDPTAVPDRHVVVLSGTYWW